jgi:energy-converting hydrogenase A subunit I
MERLRITSYLMFVISVVGILYALLFNPAVWLVYAISVVFIPIAILSLGLVIMAKGRKEEEEDKTREPFIGY